MELDSFVADVVEGANSELVLILGFKTFNREGKMDTHPRIESLSILAICCQTMTISGFSVFPCANLHLRYDVSNDTPSFYEELLTFRLR